MHQLLNSEDRIWDKHLLGDLCTKFDGLIQTGPFGSQLHQHDYVDDGTPVLMPKDIIDYKINLNSVARISDENVQRLKKHKLNVGDLLLPRRGEISKNVLITKDESGFICGTGCLKITPPSVIFPAYFTYYLRTSYMIDWLESNAVGATMQNLSSAILYKLPVILPSFEIQQKIATILFAYDDLIENNLKRIKLLEEMAQITYEEWFVRLKFPGHETTPMDSETGLPEGWEKTTIGQVCTISGGGTPSTEVDEYWNNGNIAWFSPTDLSKNNSLVILDSSHKITEIGLQKSSAKLLQPNSFMITSRATIGLFGLFDKPFCTNQGFINVTPHESGHKHFLLFNFKFRVPELLNHASGATFLEISRSNFKKLYIDWPSNDLIKKWEIFSNPIIQELTNLSKQNQLLKEARDILLPRLMTGMIDVDTIQLPE